MIVALGALALTSVLVVARRFSLPHKGGVTRLHALELARGFLPQPSGGFGAVITAATTIVAVGHPIVVFARFGP
jgi:hypothetical protein